MSCARYPGLGIVEVSEGYGIDRTTGELVRAALAAEPGIAAVYSIGGGNAAIVEAFRDMGRICRVFVGHDLDVDNLALLRSGSIEAELHHDLRQDMRSACQNVMRAHGALPRAARMPLSGVQVITPYNLPSELIA